MALGGPVFAAAARRRASVGKSRAVDGGRGIQHDTVAFETSKVCRIF